MSSGNQKKDNQMSGKADPVEHLNDECMIHVLSFVWESTAPRPWSDVLKYATIGESANMIKHLQLEGVCSFEPVEEETAKKDAGGNGANANGSGGVGDEANAGAASEATEDVAIKRKRDEILGVAIHEAMAFDFQLSAVSCSWQKFIGRALLQLIPSLGVNFDDMPDMYEPVCTLWLRKKQPSIKSITCRHLHLQPLASLTLEFCDTTRLDWGSLGLHLPDESPTITADIWNDGQELSSQRRLQNDLASECPKLEGLFLWTTLKGVGVNLEDSISPSLFSHENVTDLNINVRLEDNLFGNVDPNFFSKMTQNLPSLEKLYLRCKEKSLTPSLTGVPDNENGAFHISSRSLKRLNVDKLCTERVRLSLDCPSLERFLCKGLFCFAGLNQDIVCFVRQKVVRAENVPEECIALVTHINNDDKLIAPPLRFHGLLGGFTRIVPVGGLGTGSLGLNEAE